MCAFALQQRTDRCGQQSVCSLSVLTAVDVDVGVHVCNCSAAKDWPLRAAICVQFVSAHRCGCGYVILQCSAAKDWPVQAAMCV